MSTKRQISEQGVYFITITCHDWLPLFELTNGYDIVYKWFDYLKERGHYITGFVIMPNHFHVLIAFTKSEKSINTIVGNGKRFMAYELVKRLEIIRNIEILNKLTEGVTGRDYKRGKLHEVFKPSFDWKECRSTRFINQKLNYMHDNPCRGKWNLVESTLDYGHSSARYYLTGEFGGYVFTPVEKLEDIDLAT
jgi:REP element-mobilizing transposase RayT